MAPDVSSILTGSTIKPIDSTRVSGTKSRAGGLASIALKAVAVSHASSAAEPMLRKGPDGPRTGTCPPGESRAGHCRRISPHRAPTAIDNRFARRRSSHRHGGKAPRQHADGSASQAEPPLQHPGNTWPGSSVSGGRLSPGGVDPRGSGVVKLITAVTAQDQPPGARPPTGRPKPKRSALATLRPPSGRPRPDEAIACREPRPRRRSQASAAPAPRPRPRAQASAEAQNAEALQQAHLRRLRRKDDLGAGGVHVADLAPVGHGARRQAALPGKGRRAVRGACPSRGSPPQCARRIARRRGLVAASFTYEIL